MLRRRDGWRTFRTQPSTPRCTLATLLATRPEVDAVTLAARRGHADAALAARIFFHRDSDQARALADLADGLRSPQRKHLLGWEQTR